LRLLLDEMYSPALASALRSAGTDAVTVAELGLAGRPDPDVFATAIAADRAVLTENTADFTRIGAEHLEAGLHHPGIPIALSSRFSRRPSGIAQLLDAIRAVEGEELGDRVVYLARTG
jgi:hypothetical protein